MTSWLKDPEIPRELEDPDVRHPLLLSTSRPLTAGSSVAAASAAPSALSLAGRRSRGFGLGLGRLGLGGSLRLRRRLRFGCRLGAPAPPRAARSPRRPSCPSSALAARPASRIFSASLAAPTPSTVQEVLVRHLEQVGEPGDAGVDEPLRDLFARAVGLQAAQLLDDALHARHLGLDLLALLFLALDVDAPAHELGRQPHVLALLADGEAQLLVLDHHLHDPLLLVEDGDAAHLGRRERVLDEGRRVVAPLDDVDLLAAQLADDGLHARALHADAGADRVDVLLAAR